MLINHDSKSIITPSLQSGVSFAIITGICPKMVGHKYLKLWKILTKSSINDQFYISSIHMRYLPAKFPCSQGQKTGDTKYSKTKNIINFQWKPIKNIQPEFRGKITEVEKCSRISGKEEQKTHGSVSSLYPKLDFVMSERCVPSWFQIIWKWWLSFLKFTDLKNGTFDLPVLKIPQTQTEEQFCIMHCLH